jgi:hypothetical protein
MIQRLTVVSALLSLVVGCASIPDRFSMYPNAMQSGQSVDDEMAVLLVGNVGPASVNYLQFIHSSLPAINVHGIDVAPNGIVAVPVPVGISSLSLSNYTVSGRGGGYLPNGMAFGYIPVRTPKIDISSRGLYYIATIHAGSSEGYTAQPDPAMLMQFRKTHPQLASLKPINFNWPR